MQKSRIVGIATMVGAMFLAGCGGGSSGSATATISGVAATGAAIASGAVTLKCASGTTYSTVTGADGKFNIDIANVALPCLAQVAYTDGAGAAKKLRTIITSAGTANITPITELVLAKLSGGTAASAFDNFNAETVKGYTASDITAAVAAVKTYISGLGVSVANFPADPIGTKFVPANGSTSGDAVDALLDSLKAQLAASGTTLDQAVAAVSTGGTSGGGGSSKDGPAVDQTALATLCPNNVTGSIYNACKVPSSGSTINPVLSDINAWVKTNSSGLKVTQAAFGATLGEACTFQFEPFLGIAVLSTPSMSSYGTELMTGRTTDEIDLDANGLVGYLSAGESFVTGTVGQLEVNFPSITSNGALEVVYGKAGVNLICSTK